MSTLVRLAMLSAVVMAGIATVPAAAPAAFNIAHRGASAYAPEHTLDAYELAMAQGADYVEQDLCITKDGVLVVSHDPTLERTTNVEELFPDRFTPVTTGGTTARRWFIEDLTLAEIKRLDSGSWFGPKFAGRRILTFQEAIDFVKGKAGFFPELKTPGRLRAKGFDVEKAVADILAKNGLVGATFKGRPAVHLQAFEDDSVRRLAALLPTVPRSFLIGTPEMAKRWLSPEGLKEAATFATGVAPSRILISQDPAIVSRAHAAGLTVVPYTFGIAPNPGTGPQASTDHTRRGSDDARAALTGEMRKFIEVYKVDGLFTDNPDLFPR
jgi:glycerophosphoryl diester phosphodiesterase